MRHITIITTALLLLSVITATAQDKVPATVGQLTKWEKERRQEAANGDADACRALYMSNPEKYSAYAQQAIELYEQQQTGEAYYHLAEIYAADTERRDTLLQRSADLGYQPAAEQIEALQRSAATMRLQALDGQPMRYKALDLDFEPTAADAPFFMEKAREYESIHHRREAIWYYDLAYELDPEGCSQAQTRSQRLLSSMRADRRAVEEQLAAEQMQREINSMQWQALANSASQLAGSLQQFQSRPTAHHVHTASSSSAGSKSSSAGSSSYTSSSSSRSGSSASGSKSSTRKTYTSSSTGSSRSKKTCTKCGGSGKVTCYHCKGSGRQTCGGCSGKGYNPYAKKGTVCTTCNGKSTVRCGICFGNGRLNCNNCAGTGKTY